MTKKNANLNLYYGLCNSDGLSEGKFYLPKDNPWSKRRFFRGMHIVQRYLQPDYYWGLKIGGFKLVRNEDEAKDLIQFAERNIQGASGLIELIEASHGTITFWRRIRFEGWTRIQQDELVRELMKSNYKPYDRNREDIERQIISSPSGSQNYWNELMEKKLKKIKPDKVWKDALKYL
ncbi:hypothetical protein JW949_04155 [Candidatus Woesearchaeota archaeon]|nr:hypothetical protein [Candidatus Woesearchaeota archaeon]